MNREVSIALAQTSASAILWGTSFPVIGAAISNGLDPVFFVFVRFALAAPLMLALAAGSRRELRVLLRSRGVWVLGFLNAVGFLCQFIGQQRTSASVAALLVNLSVILATAGGAVFLGEGLGALRLFGVVLAFSGTVVIATGGALSSLGGGEVIGDSLYLVSAGAWAWYIVYAKRRANDPSWAPLPLASSIITATAVFLAPAALVTHFPASLSLASWEAIAYTVVLNTVAPFVLYQAGLRHITASLSAVVLTLQIVVAVLISTLFLGEGFTLVTGSGALAVLASILLVSAPEATKRAYPSAIGAPD